ncbi:TRAP transporter small permease [Leisingera sp. M658]|uniref:TRAP transporter small permease n=1 Tax=Leisingera sp. M658 TaxID=2867015 RepID=UPI0021A6549E|nr:TRAP transporter small permease [Leisingera sp. M658]UWQ75822.1 TRAP transporter small permease [Leisingera sp. M658]
MQQNTRRMGFIERLGPLLAALGAIIIVIQTIWISYGVVMRYVFNAPDLYVTEATALMLVPCAFLGLAYAMQMDALPKVTMFVDVLPGKLARIVRALNLIIMLAVGGFFAFAATEAFFRASRTGASSEVLSWPRAWFWAPTALALIIFCLILFVIVFRTLKNKTNHSTGEEN